ncbi:HesA/MoeB/ThiF family protein [Thermogymnomonas acidicola]|uniref:HesA/MoeB/ThiF family protein n=1 Tax=Thermogymnomonas acidicola TaxID=399579 RepID=UPI00094684B1|nr:HesA/MoeB/ThiF family protein [Thermogymnomonas acidicola]
MAELIVRSGFGSLTLVDMDYVSISNVQRQVLFTAGDVGEPKAEVAERKLSAIGSGTKLTCIPEEFSPENATTLVSGADLVVECTDSLEAAMVANDACVKLGKPLVHMSAIEEYGQIKAYTPPGLTSCLACFMPESLPELPTCSQIGVLASVPSLVSAMAFSVLLNVLRRRDDGALYFVDARELSVQKVRVERNVNCRACARGDYIHLRRRP